MHNVNLSTCLSVRLVNLLVEAKGKKGLSISKLV